MLAFLLIFSFFLGIKTLINLDYFSVKTVSVIGVDNNLAQKIKKLADNFVESQNTWLVSNKNVVFLDKNALSATILNFFPDLEKVKTVSTGLGNLVINAQEKTPFAIWCNQKMPEKCALVDSSGFAFNATSSENYPGLLKVINNSNPMVGANFMNEYTFSLIKDISNKLLTKKFKPISASLADKDFFVTLDDKTEIIFSLDSNTEDTVADLVSVHQDLEKDGKWPVQYVDLRYGKKIFIKPLKK